MQTIKFDIITIISCENTLILIRLHCVWHSRVVNACAFQPLRLGLNRVRVLNALNENSRSTVAYRYCSLLRNGKGDARRVLFFLENLALRLELGQQCQDASLRDSNYVAAAFSLLNRKRHTSTITLDCSCLCTGKFRMTSFS